MGGGICTAHSLVNMCAPNRGMNGMVSVGGLAQELINDLWPE